jgi:FkbM family methyltransferase
MTVSFVLANCAHGAMIVNRLDYNTGWNGGVYGVGAQILGTGGYDLDEISIVKALLQCRRTYFRDGVVMVDCGANIGVHAVECADMMREWGSVLAIEAQERIFYALAGNLALHNCFNARALWAAVGTLHSGCFIDSPEPDYQVPGSFGSFELKDRLGREDIGQPIDYEKGTRRIPIHSLDDMHFPRLDFLKIDVEGMEMDVLHGAEATISACKPIMLVEHIKIDPLDLKTFLEAKDYEQHSLGLNVLAMHKDDPCRDHFEMIEHTA